MATFDWLATISKMRILGQIVLLLISVAGRALDRLDLCYWAMPKAMPNTEPEGLTKFHLGTAGIVSLTQVW